MGFKMNQSFRGNDAKNIKEFLYLYFSNRFDLNYKEKLDTTKVKQIFAGATRTFRTQLST